MAALNSRLISLTARYRLRGLLDHSLVRAALLTLCAWPVVAIAHQLLLMGVAGSLHRILGADAAAATLVASGGDEVYSRLAIGMLAGAQPAGLALQGLIGYGLNALAPGLFASPSELDPGSWSAVVFAAGSSSVGIQLAQVIANVGLAMAGTALLVLSCTRPRRRGIRRVLHLQVIRVAGALCLACGAGAELGVFWGSGSGGEIALSMVATKMLGLPSNVYDGAIAAGLPLSLAINLVLVGTATGVALAAALAIVRLWLGRGSLVRLRSAALALRPERALAPALLLPVLIAAAVQPGIAFNRGAAFSQASALNLPPPGFGAAAQQDWADGPHDPAEAIATKLLDPATPGAETITPGETIRPGAGSVVTILSMGDGFEYRVNGRRTFIRGIGYNAMTAGLSLSERAARLDRDFGEMHDFGANTLLGWNELEFDELLLDKAAEHGLGVIVPFNLDSTWAYDDPRVRQQVMRDVADRVARLKDSPALRVWGLGNEVVHDITKSRSPRGPVFSRFLVDTADLIHALDPAHPVVYRDAEDVYVAPVAAALRSDGRARPWFIYGMNFFTTRMEDALSKGPTRGLRQPLLISEFGPVGLRPADRPAAYSRFWNVIWSHRQTLLGGFAYVWTTAGPEPLDRGFGLTNDAGEPVDGSISALSKLFASIQDDDASSAGAGNLTSSR